MNKLIENVLLLWFKLLPLQKKVVFRSFNGHFSDSPKAISEKLHEKRPDIKIVWILNRDGNVDVPDYINVVETNSFCSVYHLSTAAAFVDNNYGRKGIVVTDGSKNHTVARILVWLNSKANQLNVSTWHGTPMKKIGNDAPNSKGLDLITPPLFLLHPNTHTQEVLDRITFHRAHNFVIGLPRNDLLFDKGKTNSIKKKLGLSIKRKIVLYAPTFRSDGYDTENRNLNRSGLNQLNEIDFDRLFQELSTKFGDDDWTFVGRFHYFVEKEVDWNRLEKKYPGRIINGNLYDDMSEYLSIADILITDCSSCMFDFVFTKRPVFLYFPDIDYYRSEERGFYFDMGELPFSCAQTFDELIENIEEFDENDYIIKINKMNEMLGAVDDGLSSERAVNFIISNSRYLQRK